MADDTTDWSKVDSDWVAENRPDKLSATHMERLIQKHGDRAGTEKFQNALLRHLRGVQIATPYRKIIGK